MKILILFGPNMNLLGSISRSTGLRLTLDKMKRSLRLAARELSVDVSIFQIDDEVQASKLVARQRNKCDGILVIPGLWNEHGHLLVETLQIVGKPLGLYHLMPKGGPWKMGVALFADIASVNGSGEDQDGPVDILRRLVEKLRD